MRVDLDDPRTRFVVASGRHRIGVSRHAFKPGTRDLGSEYATACIDVAAGHGYTVRPLFQADGSWAPAVYDTTAGTEVATTCAHQPVVAEDGVADGTADAAASTPGPIAASVTAPADDRRPHRPGTGIAVRSGAAYGGDMLVSEPPAGDILDAGDGWQVGVGGMITPLWNARDFGLGAGAELGWKSPLIGGDVWFTRFPVLATVHVLARVHKAWYLKLDAGVEKDLHCRLSRGSGHAEVNLQGNTGLVGEIGLFVLAGRHGAIDGMLRYSRVRYTEGPTNIDGSSFGLNLGMHYQL